MTLSLNWTCRVLPGAVLVIGRTRYWLRYGDGHWNWLIDSLIDQGIELLLL